jgi:hypothetical protein
MKMKVFLSAIALLLLTGCASSYPHAQNREDAIEVDIDGRIIRVVDLGSKVEMIRKGYTFSGDTTAHWEDHIKAGEIVTGCKITNLVNKQGTEGYVWVEALKDCSSS